MRTSIQYIALVIATLLGHLASAQEGWIEVDLSHYNPDWELRRSSMGARLTAAWTPGNWAVIATHNTIDTKFVNDTQVHIKDKPFGNWNELWISRWFRPGDATAIELGLQAQAVSLENRTETGFSIGATLHHQISKTWRAQVRFAGMELVERDVRITGELGFRFRRNNEVIMRIDDYAEFDFTWYEIGYRFHFQ